MAEGELPNKRIHDDPDLFREALNFTAAETSFPARLIEKDYFCTLLLAHLCKAEGQLVFKGGTCLAKVHGDFYRLSEDLDFAISMPVVASRSERRKRATTVKNTVAGLGDSLSCFHVKQPFRGANESTQYLASIGYSSIVTRQEETITIEISLREPLLDPISGGERVSPIAVPCIARAEAFAEKCRAALTRRDIAIRDFYDVDYAVRMRGLRPDDAELVGLIKRKLAVPGNDPINVSPNRLVQLRGQLGARLKAVLRTADFEAFDLDRAFQIVSRMAQRLAD